MGEMDKKTFIAILALIVAAGFFIRFYQLDMKLMHNDEATLYYWDIKPIIEGQGVYWDSESHGILPYYLTAPFVDVLGFSEFSIRIAAALFGAMTIGLLYFLRKEIGDIGVLVSAAFLAVSPTFVFYSRQFTGYPFYLFFLLLFIIIGVKLLEEYDQFRFYGLCVTAAFLCLINEAFFIFLFILLLFFILVLLWSWHKGAENEKGIKKSMLQRMRQGMDKGYDAHLKEDSSQKNIKGIRHADRQDIRHKIREYIKKIDKVEIGIGIMIFLLVFILIHTCFMTRGANLDRLASMPFDFFDKASNTRHVKPFLYYFNVILPIEIGLIAMLILGFVFLGKKPFFMFIAFWSISSLLIFSMISYKTNWMITVVLFPLILFAGMTAQSLTEEYGAHKGKKTAISIVLIILLGLTLFYSINENFRIYDKSVKNNLGYLETSDDTLRLVSDIKEYSRETGKANVTVNIKVVRGIQLWYYLREFQVSDSDTSGEVNISDTKSYDILIGYQGQFADLEDSTGAGNYYSKDYKFKFNTIDKENITVVYKKVWTG